MEYVGDLDFEAQEFDLDSIPNNEEAAKTTDRVMPYVRIAALMFKKNVDELAKDVAEDPDVCIEMLEGIVWAMKVREQDINILSAGYVRLQVAMERAIGEQPMSE